MKIPCKIQENKVLQAWSILSGFCRGKFGIGGKVSP